MSVFENSVNQWCIGKDRSAVLSKSILLGGNLLYYSPNTNIVSYSADDVTVVILGTCVDIEDEYSQGEIPSRLSQLPFDEFILAIDRLCGTYVIFRSEGGGGSGGVSVHVFGDATHMMPIYYGTEGKYKGVSASCEALIVDDPAAVSDAAKEVVKGAYSSLGRHVGDMTMYEGVRCLLPNHYLELKKGVPVRFFPRESVIKAISSEEINNVVDKTIRWTSNVIKQIAGSMRLASPLTAGGDSRVNCAFLKKFLPNDDILYYVLQTKDIAIDKRNLEFVTTLAETMQLKDFRVYPIEESISEEQKSALCNECGPTRDWGRTIWTYNPDIGMFGSGRTVVNGQLIGSICGTDTGKYMPSWLVSCWYIKTLWANVSRKGEYEIKKWYKEAKAGSCGFSMLDMWCWEIRDGRWSSNLLSISGLMGIRDISLFNCNKMIAEWCRVPRKMRTHKLIHHKILERLMPSIGSVPFNPRHLAKIKSEHVPRCFDKLVPRWMRDICRFYLFKYVKKLGK